MIARNLGMIAAACFLGGTIEANAQNLGDAGTPTLQVLPRGGFDPSQSGLSPAKDAYPAQAPALGGLYANPGNSGRLPVIPDHGSYHYGPDGGYGFRYGYVPSFGAGYPYPPMIVGPPTTYGALYRPQIYISPKPSTNVRSGLQNNLGGLRGALRATSRRK